jgi:hypothetical protein
MWRFTLRTSTSNLIFQRLMEDKSDKKRKKSPSLCTRVQGYGKIVTFNEMVCQGEMIFDRSSILLSYTLNERGYEKKFACLSSRERWINGSHSR